MIRRVRRRRQRLHRLATGCSTTTSDKSSFDEAASCTGAAHTHIRSLWESPTSRTVELRFQLDIYTKSQGTFGTDDVLPTTRMATVFQGLKRIPFVRRSLSGTCLVRVPLPPPSLREPMELHDDEVVQTLNTLMRRKGWTKPT